MYLLNKLVDLQMTCRKRDEVRIVPISAVFVDSFPQIIVFVTFRVEKVIIELL
jgi:hypothetical protein